MSSIPFAEDMEEIRSTVQLMRRREVRYNTKKIDYLSQSYPESIDIDEQCRTIMIQWCYNAVTFCGFNRSTVEIAIEYVDRFLSKPVAGQYAMKNRTVFQLVCMTALYTAVKTHEPICMDPELIAKLSQGLYSAAEVEAMESFMLDTLEWLVNPPTSSEFVHLYLDSLPNEYLSAEVQETVLAYALKQCEVALTDYNVSVSTPASMIAYYSVLDAFQKIGVESKVSQHVQMTVGVVMSDDLMNTEKHNQSIDCATSSSSSSSSSQVDDTKLPSIVSNNSITKMNIYQSTNVEKSPQHIVIDDSCMTSHLYV